MFLKPYAVWNWRGASEFDCPAGRIHTTAGLAGYSVHATDGPIGTVDEASVTMGATCLVVDTESWLSGRKVLLPAGTVCGADHDDRVLHVDRSKAQIQRSPEYDVTTFGRPQYQDRVAHYYAATYLQ